MIPAPLRQKVMGKCGVTLSESTRGMKKTGTSVPYIDALRQDHRNEREESQDDQDEEKQKNNKKNKQEKKQHIKMKKGKESQRHSRLEDMAFHQKTSAGPYQLEHVRT